MKLLLMGLLLLIATVRTRGQGNKIMISEGRLSFKNLIDTIERATGFYVHYPSEIAVISDSCICSKGMNLTYDEILKAFFRGGWILSHYKHTIWIRKRKAPL